VRKLFFLFLCGYFSPPPPHSRMSDPYKLLSASFFFPFSPSFRLSVFSPPPLFPLEKEAFSRDLSICINNLHYFKSLSPSGDHSPPEWYFLLPLNLLRCLRELLSTGPTFSSSENAYTFFWRRCTLNETRIPNLPLFGEWVTPMELPLLAGL